MSTSIYSALSGLKVKEQELEVVANNMANVNTTGYKEEQLTFEAVLSKNASKGNSTPFVSVKEKNINFMEGHLMTTNNPYDYAIQGTGFFEVQNEKGNFLTRNGQFLLNQDGTLSSVNGDTVLGTNGPIKLEPGSQVEVSTAGILSVNGEEKGKLKIVSVDDPKKIKSMGGTLYKAQENAVLSTDSTSQVFQGKLEQSNTNVMRGIVKLIDISRQYQSYQKIMSNQTKIEQEAVSSLGRVG